MTIFPITFWLCLGLTMLALLLSGLFPPLAAMLGAVAALLFLRLILGGGG